jgi:putative membrane protein
LKLFSMLAAVAGVAMAGILVAYFGGDAVVRSLVAIGWMGFAAVCLLHLGLTAAMGIAWGMLLPGAGVWAPIWGRLIRDAGSELLPFSQVGGYVLGARAITLAGVSGSSATSSTIVDVTMELFGQLVLTAFALCWLLALRRDSPIAIPASVGLVIAALLAVGFVVVQRRGFDVFGRFTRLLGHGWADQTTSGAATLHVALRVIYQRRARVWGSFLLHLACWAVSTLEAWVALQFAGAPLDIPTVLIIETLLYAVRSVAFAVPNAVGVQEGAYVLLGAGLGLTPEMGLALSLMKRARDLIIGLPALASWQLLEGGRLWALGRWRRLSVKTPGTRPGASASPAGCGGKE